MSLASAIRLTEFSAPGGCRCGWRRLNSQCLGEITGRHGDRHCGRPPSARWRGGAGARAAGCDAATALHRAAQARSFTAAAVMLPD